MLSNTKVPSSAQLNLLQDLTFAYNLILYTKP